jgi:hypothetical protein
LERLEDRALLSSFTAATVSDLIADINAANAAGGSNTITLAKKTPFNLTVATNTTDGPTGLPVIAAGDNLSIVGNNDTIRRSSASGIPAFRLFDVASGASLSLQNMTLQDGWASGSGTSAYGGAVYSNGDLALNGVTVQLNAADLAGAGIYVAGGTANLSSDTLYGNGGSLVGLGGSLVGGFALYVAAGTVTLSHDTVETNGNSQFLSFGAIYIAGGTVTLTDDNVERNIGAIYITGGVVTLSHDHVDDNQSGQNVDAAIYISGGLVTFCQDAINHNNAPSGDIQITGTATVYIDAYTVHNTGSVVGPYTLQNC